MQIDTLASGHVVAAGACLASAFSADPAFLWALGSPENSAARLTPLFTRLTALDAKRNEGLSIVAAGDDDGGVDGVAVWKGIDDWKGPATDLVRLAPVALRTFGWSTLRLVRALTRIEAAHPTAPHYYLDTLGTRASAQGRGIGTALLAPMLERCDREGVPAYLESSNPQNVPFYARHGFEVSGTFDLPDDWPTFTPMWREPR